MMCQTDDTQYALKLCWQLRKVDFFKDEKI